MNSVDDSPVVTPAETSNLSSPESSSSEFSQATVKLEPKSRKTQQDAKRNPGAEARNPALQAAEKLRTSHEPKVRRTQQDAKRNFGAELRDSVLQVLQVADQEDRRLIERSGRAAQITRASVRSSPGCEQLFRPIDPAEKSEDQEEGPWPKRWYQPRKCRSATCAGSREASSSRRLKKRHSYGVESSRKRPESRATLKRYSAGDFLRQQILEDLDSTEILGKTEEQIAEDRCNRVKAYLSQRHEESASGSPEDKLARWSSRGGGREEDSSGSARTDRREELERVRAYLRDKIRAKMAQEERRRDDAKRWSAECASDRRLPEVAARLPDHGRSGHRGNYPARRARSDAHIPREASSSDSEWTSCRFAGSSFRNRQGETRRGRACRRTRSEIVPETIIDFEDNEVKARYFMYSGGRRNPWKTKSGVTFEKKHSLPAKNAIGIDRDSGTSSADRGGVGQRVAETWDQRDQRRKDGDQREYCRRSRSDTATSRPVEIAPAGRRTKQRSVSWSDKRKLLRRSSGRTAPALDSTSVDSEVDAGGLPRGRSQQRHQLCSWREYKERRRQEQLRKELANAGDHENLKVIGPTSSTWQCSPRTSARYQPSRLLTGTDDAEKPLQRRHPDQSEDLEEANNCKTNNLDELQQRRRHNQRDHRLLAVNDRIYDPEELQHQRCPYKPEEQFLTNVDRVYDPEEPQHRRCPYDPEEPQHRRCPYKPEEQFLTNVDRIYDPEEPQHGRCPYDPEEPQHRRCPYKPEEQFLTNVDRIYDPEEPQHRRCPYDPEEPQHRRCPYKPEEQFLTNVDRIYDPEELQNRRPLWRPEDRLLASDPEELQHRRSPYKPEGRLLTNVDRAHNPEELPRRRPDQSAERLLTNDDKVDDATNTNESCPELTSENANDTETETILQENYLLLDCDQGDPEESQRSPTISRLQVNEYREPEEMLSRESSGRDFGYDSISRRREAGPRGNGGRVEFNANSNVKKTDTFRIVDGSEDPTDYQCGRNIGASNFVPRETWWPWNDPKGWSRRPEVISSSDDALQAGTTGTRGCHSQTDDSVTSSLVAAADDDEDDDNGDDDDDYVVAPSNKDIATDYFRRVYELLKRRQGDSKRDTPEHLTRRDCDTSSTNCDEQGELRRRRRRKRKDKNCQGEDLVAVSPGVRGDDGWGVERLLVDNEPGNLIFRRPQLQNVAGQKRPRQPAPPIPANCKINAKDISKYFDYPNKENSPRNGLNERSRGKQRNESTDQQQDQQVDSNDAAMGSNLSRHNGKGLTGRRTQSSGDLCDPKGKINHVGKILVPCSSTQRERYKICGSLPNHLDDKEILEDDAPRENNNVISDAMVGNFGGTLPHKKRSLGVHFSDASPTGTLDLVKHRSQDSLEGDPWRYQEGVDLDLVRCKHGSYDAVRRNQSGADAVDGDSSSVRTCGTIGRSSEGKCYRGADLDLVGALPKRRPAETRGGGLRQSFEARQNRSLERAEADPPMKLAPRPETEFTRQRQFERVVDLKLSRLAGGEPQDQGYASERSPEDEHPPSLPGDQPFPKVTAENTFRVTLQKSSRGLGLSVSGGGTAGPVRVKRLFPQQPAALSKKLQSGDILLAANGVPLTGLTNYEALEVLRTTPSTVELVVCRVPGDASVTSPGAPPPPPARREPPSCLRILNPQPPLQIEPCGEFDIEMTKVGGSLGFTLRKVDSSALGHYVRALVREPALSDGRIQPGDKIVSVDGAPLSPMSHEEAVALLRQCGPRVKLRLYRDLAQTPVSALSPTEPDHPLRPPRTSLRQEAVDMLCDLAVRKLSPDASNGSSNRQASGASCHSPRRLRKPLSRNPTAENDHENHLTFHAVHSPPISQAEASDTDQCSINTQATNSQSEAATNDIIDPPALYDVCESSDSSRAISRPSFLDLSARPEKPHFQFSLESESDYTGPMIVTESDSNPTGDCEYDERLPKEAAALSSEEPDSSLPSEPASMPPLISAARTTSGAFSYKNPAYQSANPTCGGGESAAKSKTAHSSDQDIPGKVLGAEDPAGSKGLLKWKGVMFAPNDEVAETTGQPEAEEAKRERATEVAPRSVVSEDENEVFTVELTRGWNSRLGFSLQPEGNSTVISVVHPDSVAAKDGRLTEGDILIMVNDESVENMPTAEIIDLLRKIRGSIGITVMRKTRTKNAS